MYTTHIFFLIYGFFHCLYINLILILCITIYKLFIILIIHYEPITYYNYILLLKTITVNRDLLPYYELSHSHLNAYVKVSYENDYVKELLYFAFSYIYSNFYCSSGMWKLKLSSNVF